MICKHETEWCKNHVHCNTCEYYNEMFDELISLVGQIPEEYLGKTVVLEDVFKEEERDRGEI